MSDLGFLARLGEFAPGLSAGVKQKIDAFRELVIQENEVQNLTRLLSIEDFLDGHILDCLELIKSGFLGSSCMDLGAGAGVPGIPCVLMDPRPWVLIDSELRKADFLMRATEALQLEQVKVFAGRAEKWLVDESIDCIVARAIGPVDRILGWIGGCSTWNKLILLKGKSWSEEWASSQSSKARKRLRITAEHHYTAGPDLKQRTIVLLERVAR